MVRSLATFLDDPPANIETLEPIINQEREVDEFWLFLNKYTLAELAIDIPKLRDLYEQLLKWAHSTRGYFCKTNKAVLSAEVNSIRILSGIISNRPYTNPFTPEEVCYLNVAFEYHLENYETSCGHLAEVRLTGEVTQRSFKSKTMLEEEWERWKRV